MCGLDVQHHLGYGMFGGWRFDGGALAPLARGKPVKRQLLGILIGHNARVTHAPTPVSS